MRLLSRFKSCTRCSCPVCLLRDETAAHEEQTSRTTREFLVDSRDTMKETINDLERRLNRSRTISQFLAIATGLFTIVFYAKYGW